MSRSTSALLAALAVCCILTGCPTVDDVRDPIVEIPVAYQATPEEPGLDWFDSYERLAPDADGPDAARRGGIERVELLVEIARALLEDFEIDPATEEFIERLDGGFLDFDVHELYRAFPHADRGGRREVVFIARLVDGRYSFALAEPAELSGLAPGDLYSRIRLTPLPKGALDGEAYLLDGEMGIETGPVGGSEILDFVTETLRGVETVAGESGTRRPVVSGAAESLGDEDWRLLASIERAYPATFGWLQEFFRLEDLLTRPEDGPGVSVTSRFGPRIEAFEGRYPRLHAFMSSSDFEFRTAGVYVDADGHERIRHSLASSDYLFRASTRLEDGAVLAVDRRGEAVEAPPFRLPEGIRGESRYDLEARFRGLHMILVGMPAEVQLATGEEGFLLTYRFRRKPQVARIDGKIYGVIPDWLMMVDFNELLGQVLETVVKGRYGRGTEVGISWRRQAEGESLLRVRVQSELPAEGILRFLYKFWKRRFLPSFRSRGERSQFKNRFLSNLLLDLQAGREATAGGRGNR